MEKENDFDLEQVFAEQRAMLLRRIERRIGMNPFADFTSEDVLHEAFLDAHRSVGQLRDHGERAVTAWLCKIVDNRLAQTFRDRARIKRGGPKPRGGVGGSSILDLAERLIDKNNETGSTRLLKSEIMNAVRLAIVDLPEQQQRVVSKYYVEERSLDEIASEEELTNSAVRGLIYRAKPTLKRTLGNSSRWYTKK